MLLTLTPLTVLSIALPQVNVVSDLYHGLPKSILASTHLTNAISVKGILSEVDVIWDDWGVPHIYANNKRDLFFALGYAMATDRLWQMDLLRRLAEGNLSVIVGESVLSNDIMMRKLGIVEHAKSIYNYLRECSECREVADLLDSFTSGVNSRIRYVIDNNLLPPEYYLLGIKPEKWRPWDSIAIGMLISYMLSFSEDDLYLDRFLKANGLDSLLELDFLNRSLNTPIISNLNLSGNQIFSAGKLVLGNSSARALEVLDVTVNDSLIRSARRILEELIGFNLFSNNWVISGNLSATGSPILANDPHLSLTVPPIWYLAQIALKDDSYNVFGAFIPGIPFVIIGRNHYVSWGFTNAEVDVVDFYYYVWRNGKYYYNGKWLNPTIRNETILVRYGNHYITKNITVMETVHGPIIDDENKIAVSWAGLNMLTDMLAFYYASTSRSIYDVLNAFKKYYIAPPQNLVVADSNGNIAYLLIGSIPVRKGAILEIDSKVIVNRGFLPFNGSNNEGLWKAWIPPDEMPHLINPAKGFIATANNKPVDLSKYPYYLGWHWLDRYRYERIVEYIIEKNPLSDGDMMNLQHDVKSKAAEILLPLMIELLMKKPINGELYDAVRMLESWNYVMDKDRVEPAVFTLWLMNLHKDLWGDELAKANISSETFLTLEFTELVLRRELENPGSMRKWVGGDISSLLEESLRKALNQIEEMSGKKWYDTKWGEIHYYVFEHPLGEYISGFNYPSLPASGGFYTVNVAPWLRVTIGPSLRAVFEMSSDKSLAIIPGGNSGIPFSRHYSDQLEGWYTGVYLVVWLPTSYPTGEKLVLKP